MKKTILSVAVGMASFGAFAAQGVVAPAHDAVAQSIENVEVFGKLGVSYDDYDASVDANDDKGIDYKRNTEIGLQTSADLSHGLKASAVVVGNFDNEKEDFRLDKVEMGVEHDLAALHFGKIDDRYDLATGKFDQFSEVFNGTKFERYNATDKVEGVALSASPLAGLGLALQLGEGSGDQAELGDDVAVSATYHFAGIDMAAAYRTVDQGSHSKALQDEESFKLGAGYGLSGLYAGLVYESTENFDKTEVETIGLSASYKYEALTVKAGYLTDEHTAVNNSKYDEDTLRFAAQYDLQENVELHAGYAKVDSDKANSDEDLFTAGMIVRF